MRIGILGPLEVTVDGGTCEVSGARLRALLTRLALDAGRWVSVDALADALWGDALPADRANAVQSLVSRLRRAVPGVPVPSGPGGYQLDLPADAIDAHRFERLAASGRQSLADGHPHAAAETLGEALALWRGAALADLAGAGTGAAGTAAIAAIARLDELRLAATEDRVEAELRTGPSAALVAELEELAAANPLRERLCGLRLEALAATGRPAQALAAYEEFRRRLADELGADPSPELKATHLAVLRGTAVAPPPRRGARLGNLRAALNSFVGRDDELERVLKQLGESRLVTLVGPGGAGKTRLASVAAGRLSAGTDGGAWLIELAPVTDPAAVPRAILDTLSRGMDAKAAWLPEVSPPRDTIGRLVELLAPADALLVVDNCEHLVDAAARVVDDVLARCPRLRVLATSREPLAVYGEVLCPVPPLRLPAADAPPAEALTFPSVQLLADRAAAVRPGFAVTDANVRAVVEICRRLDGLPLAIELAAARLRTLSPQQVADRLDDRFRLLTGGSRTAMPRHRTLRAVVAWSWDLMSDDEQRLTEWLSVFAATVTAESATGVAGPDAGDLLDALVDKSLLQVAGDGRYRMLETIREFGLERLAEAGTVAEARAAHAAYFLRLVETADPHLRTAEQLPWLRLLDAERDNIYGALQFACDSGDADTAVRIAAGLVMPLTIKGDYEQSATLFARAAAVPGPAPENARAIVRAMAMLGEVFSGGRPPDDSELAAMLADVRASDLHASPYVALIEPITTLFTDNTAAGLAAVERGMAHPDPWTRAMLLVMRGQIEENDGDADGMLRDLTAASGVLREIGERWGLAMCLSALADALTKRGDFEAATGVLEESLALSKEINADDDVWYQRMWLAMTRSNRGDIAGARAELAQFVAELTGPRDGRAAAWALFLLGELARCGGEPDEALALYAASQARQDVAPMVAPQFRALLRTGEAYAMLAKGDPQAARRLADEAVRHGIAGRDMPVTAQTAVAQAALRLADGDAVGAAETLGAADSLRGHVDRSNADAARLAARLREALGDAEYEAAYGRGWTMSRADALALVDPDR